MLDYLGEGGVTSSAPLKLTDFYGTQAGPKPPELAAGSPYEFVSVSTANLGVAVPIAINAGDTICVAWGGSYGSSASGDTFTIKVNGQSTQMSYIGAGSRHGQGSSTSRMWLGYCISTGTASSFELHIACPGGSARTHAGYVWVNKGTYTKDTTEGGSRGYSELDGKRGGDGGFQYVINCNGGDRHYQSLRTGRWNGAGGDNEDFDVIVGTTHHRDGYCQSQYRVVPDGVWPKTTRPASGNPSAWARMNPVTTRTIDYVALNEKLYAEGEIARQKDEEAQAKLQVDLIPEEEA